MGKMASPITSLTIVYSTVYSGAYQGIHQELRVTGLCVRNSPVTGEFSAQMASNAEMFPFDDVIFRTVWRPAMNLTWGVLHWRYYVNASSLL